MHEHVGDTAADHGFRERTGDFPVFDPETVFGNTGEFSAGGRLSAGEAHDENALVDFPDHFLKRSGACRNLKVPACGAGTLETGPVGAVLGKREMDELSITDDVVILSEETFMGIVFSNDSMCFVRGDRQRHPRVRDRCVQPVLPDTGAFNETAVGYKVAQNGEQDDFHQGLRREKDGPDKLLPEGNRVNLLLDCGQFPVHQCAVNDRMIKCGECDIAGIEGRAFLPFVCGIHDGEGIGTGVRPVGDTVGIHVHRKSGAVAGDHLLDEDLRVTLRNILQQFSGSEQERIGIADGFTGSKLHDAGFV